MRQPVRLARVRYQHHLNIRPEPTQRRHAAAEPGDRERSADRHLATAQVVQGERRSEPLTDEQRRVGRVRGAVEHVHEPRHRVEAALLAGTRRRELRASELETLSRAAPADGLQAVNIQLTGGVELVNRNQEAIRPVSTRIERSKHPANTKICAEGGQLDATRSRQSGLFAPVWGRRRIPSLRQQLDRSTRSSITLLVAFSLCLRCGLTGQPQPFSAIDVGLDRSATVAPFDAGEIEESLSGECIQVAF